MSGEVHSASPSELRDSAADIAAELTSAADVAARTAARENGLGDGDVEDEVLIEQAKLGDRGAFETLVRRHQSAIFGYLRARTMDATDAEDLAQEVFMRCYLGRARFDAGNLVRPWLIGIARNLLREHVRRIHRRKEVAWTELCLELEDLVPDVEPMYDDVLSHLPLCLTSLGQSARQALELRYHAKLRLADIGQKLHRSEGAVKLLMFRARQALKNCLDKKLRVRSDD